MSGSTQFSGCLVSLNTERAACADISISFTVPFFFSLSLRSFAFCLFLNSLILFFDANFSLRFPSLVCFSLFSLNCLSLPYPHFVHIPPSDRNDRSCLVLNGSDVMKMPDLQFTAQGSPFTKTLSPPP